VTTPPGSPIDPSSARQRLRILVLLPFTPRLDAPHGGRVAAALIARLAERHDVALLCLRPVDGEPVDDMLRGRCGLVEEMSLGGSVPWRRPRRLWALARGRPIEISDSFHPQFAQRARALARDWRPDVVHLEMERMAQYLGALSDQPAARVLVAHEPAGANAADLYRASRGTDRVVRYLDQRAWRRFEPRALRTLDALVCYTERDRRILAAVASGVRTTTIPFAADLPEQALDPLGSDPPNVLFVGGFGHPPNVNAAVRLGRSIFPRISAMCPGAVLYIVGDKPPREVRELAREDVIVTGRVPSIEPYLNRASVFAAPLLDGGGMRIKVLEALAAGKAVVASARAAEGIPVTHADEQLVVADSDDEFAEDVARLLSDPDARRALATRAREWARKQLDWEPIVAAYERLYTEVLKHGAHAAVRG
jgi:polysaccharide biosynthesis protein PslH